MDWGCFAIIVRLQKSKLGEDHHNTLASMTSLANLYSEAGRWNEGLRLAEQVEALQKSKLGEEHPNKLRLMHSLALHYSKAGRPR
jgi:Tetratricopeptide repeat